MIYKKIATELRTRINSDDYAVGDMLPSEKALAAELKVSVMTLRKALALLEEEKLIARRHGSGTCIVRKSNYHGGELEGFNYQMQVVGVTNYRNKVIEFTLLDAPPAIAQQLKIQPGEKVYYVRRLRLIDEVPILVEETAGLVARLKTSPELVMKDKILTIDVGTGSTRAAIVRIDGAMIGFAQREYEQTTPRAGWSEQAPSLWWQAACDCIREVLYRYPETAAQIAVIGACGQMHGTVLLDDRGELVEDRALLWNDKRSQPQVDAFNAREGWEKWLAHLNNPPAAAWPAFKLAWWRENHPDRWSQLAKVLMPKDYINFMLTGAMATDYSEASCYFLMDSETRSWSSQACETFGLRVDQLPELKLSSDIIGQVTQRAADLTGLPAGIPVVAGTSDMAASLLGSGVYEPGMASDSTGTSTLMTVVSPRPLHHPLVNNLHLANAAWGGFTILDAGGDAVRWARLALADNQITHPQLLQEAAAVPAGGEGLLFLPYLTGERLAEHTNSRAQFFGLQRKHRRGHLFRAVLEGVAFASWRNLRQLQKCGQYPQQMIASGGGARSSLWLEIKAAAYNLPILSTRNQENGVTGCGIIAGVGVGLYADFASGVRQTVQFDKLISPDPRLRDYYHACCELFDTLYRQSAALYDRLDALSVGPD